MFLDFEGKKELKEKLPRQIIKMFSDNDLTISEANLILRITKDLLHNVKITKSL